MNTHWLSSHWLTRWDYDLVWEKTNCLQMLSLSNPPLISWEKPCPRGHGSTDSSRTSSGELL